MHHWLQALYNHDALQAKPSPEVVVVVGEVVSEVVLVVVVGQGERRMGGGLGGGDTGEGNGIPV